MKNIFLAIFILFVGFQIAAQESDEDDSDKIHKFVQKKAEPKGGLKKFYEKVSEEFDQKKIPPVDTKEVRITIMLTVEKDGSLSNFKVLNDQFGIAEETIRVLKNMPKWNPAELNGKVITTSFRFPIKITVN